MVLASEWDCDCDFGMEVVDEEGMKSPRAAGPHPKGELAERELTPPARPAVWS